MSLLSFLSEWTYPGPQRSIGTPYQTLYKDPADELEHLIKNDASPIYSSVNPLNEKGEVDSIDRLFFDFDNPTRISDAWDDAVKLNENLAKYYNVGALTVFSGCKGYHVYVYLQEPYKGTPEQCKAVYSELQNMIIKGEKYSTLDSAVIGDVRRCCRVPYSRHQKTGELAVPVDMGLNPIKLYQGFSRDLAENGISSAQVAQAYRNAFKPKPQPKRKYVSDGSLRPCIEAILNSSSVHDGPHLMRVAAVAEMTAEGYTPDEIEERFKHMKGYEKDNGRKTRYFIKHSIRRGYKPFRCETIQKLGGCLGEKCGRLV